MKKNENRYITVFEITNIGNGRKYYSKTADSMSQALLLLEQQGNQCEISTQINRYGGAKNFRLEAKEICLEEEADELIDLYKSKEETYRSESANKYDLDPPEKRLFKRPKKLTLEEAVEQW